MITPYITVFKPDDNSFEFSMTEPVCRSLFGKGVNHAGGKVKAAISINIKTLFALLCLSALLYCFGCTGANYGSLKNSRDVTQAFETYHVYPGHKYYYLNQENNPYAVVALQSGYTISDNQWREFDPQTKQLEKEVDLVKEFPVNYSNAYGSYLRDSSGNQIGYWYSSLQIRSFKIDKETQKVSILTDTPWLRDDDQGIGSGVGIGIGVGSGGSGIGIRIGR